MKNIFWCNAKLFHFVLGDRRISRGNSPNACRWYSKLTRDRKIERVSPRTTAIL